MTAARRALTLGLAVVATLTLAAPATAAGVATAAGASASTSAAGLPTRAQLHAARLTLADLPGGYRRDRSPDSSSTTSSSSDPACSRKLEELDSDDGQGQPSRSAEVKFRADKTFGPFVTNSLAVWRTRKPAAAGLASLRSLLRTCTRWTETDTDGTRLTVRLRRLTFPRLGADRVAMRATVTVHGIFTLSAHADMAVVRVKNAATLVTVASFGAADANLISLTRTSVTRLQRIV